jgi:hypothetical protein
MGCDIHAAIEVKRNGKWEAIKFPNPYAGETWGEDGKPEPAETCHLNFGRNYDAFAILANVRNGVGFAGVDMGEGFEPLSDGRGLPEDISEDALEQGCDGEHSATWVSLKELLDCDWTRVSQHRGVVSTVEFEKWDRMKRWNPAPDSYSGDVCGGGIKFLSVEEMRHLIKTVIDGKHGKDYTEALEKLGESRVYCRITWGETYSSSAGELWDKWFPIMLKLGRAAGERNVRMVMNFDS